MRERDFFTGRSAVVAERGMAATAHPAATLAALDVLRAGGNAVDAALAAAALLAVVEPQATGLGGDAFVLLARDGKPPVGLNGSGRAPAAATLDWYLERGIAEIAVESPHAVTVPGAVDAWCALHAAYATRPLDELFAPAIRAAREGFLVQPRVAYDWGRLAPKLAGDPVTASRYLPAGRAPAAGERVALPELARTLAAIARAGRCAFYTGRVAADLVERLRALGGLHTLEDFAANAPGWVEPLAVTYRGHEVVELPPNGQGLVAQLMLNVLAGYDLAALGEADRIHLLAEATKAAYARRDALIADPARVAVPVARLLSAGEAERIRSRIRMDRAAPPGEAARFVHGDTTYLAVVDRDRTAVSFINSLFSGFGSGITGPTSGVLLHNRAMGFRLEEGHPNAIAPGKRPLHTIIPALLARDGRSAMAFGVMGGHYQPVGHTQLVTAMLDDGLDPQSALALARSFAVDGELRLEPTIDAAVAADLAGRGHAVRRLDVPLGGGQAIRLDHARGVLIGGSEPRKDGCALGY